MYGKPFHPKRPFGEVHGDTRWAFEQDGQLFNAMKQPVDINGQLMPLPPAAAAAEAEPEIAAKPAPGNPDDDIPEDEKPFDLEAWAMGKPEVAATPWQTVRLAAAAALGDITAYKSKETLKKALREHFNIA